MIKFISEIVILSSQPGLITKSFTSLALLLVPENGFNISKLGESSAIESKKLQQSGPLENWTKRPDLDNFTISRSRYFRRELEKMIFFQSVCSQSLSHLWPPKINLKRFIYNKSISRSVFKNNAYFLSYIKFSSFFIKIFHPDLDKISRSR